MNDFREYYGKDYTPYLMHYGKGHDDNPPGRGSGRYPYASGDRPYQSDSSNKQYASSLQKSMQSFSYSQFSTLQSPEQTKKKKSGSCHDQVIYELNELKKRGINANARFLIEYNSKTNQGGTTHSFVYFKDGNKVIWFENAWEDKAGLHEFNSLKDIERYISDSRKKQEWGSYKDYDGLEFTDFKLEKHSYGESLQDLVNICLDDDDDKKK